MLAKLLLAARREQIALRPLVENAMFEPKIAAMLVKLYLAALRHVPKLVRIHVNVLRGIFQI